MTTSADTGTSTSEPDTSTSTSDGGGSSTSGGPNFCGDELPPADVIPSKECKIPPKVGVFKPVAEWKKSSWALQPTLNNSLSVPVVAPLTDDDKDGVFGSAGDMPTILVVTYSGSNYSSAVIRAVAGDGSKELFTIANQQIGALSGVAVGDLEGDGKPEIVAHAAGGTIKAFSHTGALKWTSAVHLADIAPGEVKFTYPAIADMDGDGTAEVVAGRLILNHDGSLSGKGTAGWGAAGTGFVSASFPADIDGDGVQEVIVGNAAYRPNGSALWTNGQSDGFPGVADFNGDGKPEIVVVTSNGPVRLQGADGKVLWTVANPSQKGGPPTIADFDGDKAPEIGVAGAASYTVFETDGTVRWSKVTQDVSSGITGSSVYDFEGDGVADVVYADEVDLYVYSGTDGSVKLKFDPHSNATMLEYPVIADVDNDGQVEIVLVHNTDLNKGPHTGLTVIGDMDKSWRPGRKIWNQHAYSITNIGDNAQVPAMPTPNWIKYNNFRSGDLSPPDGLSAPDLVMVTPESCVNECEGDQANLYVQLGNAGGVPLVGATIEVYGTSGGVEMLLSTVDVAMEIKPGELQQAIAVSAPSKGMDEIRLVAVAKEAECTVDAANEVVFTPPFCE